MVMTIMGEISDQKACLWVSSREIATRPLLSFIKGVRIPQIAQKHNNFDLQKLQEVFQVKPLFEG
jgi:hypothetical protein